MIGWINTIAQKNPEGTSAVRSPLDEAGSLSAVEIAHVSCGNSELCEA